MRYHISPSTGNPNICRAQPGRCPFGAEAPHYSTKDEAREAYESMQAQIPNAPLKKASESVLAADGWLREEYAKLAAPKGVFCPHCGAPADHTAGKQLISNEYAKCSCGKQYDLGDVTFQMTPEHPSYRFLSKDEVRKATWYHSTGQENWLEEIDGEAELFQAHVGTEAAAFDRGLTDHATHSSWAKPFYLYEVRLQEDVTIADSIAKDDNAPTVEAADSDVVRYINGWEDMASISLAVASNKLVIVSKRKVELQEAYERISLYNVREELPEEVQAENAWLKLEASRNFPEEALTLSPEDEALAASVDAALEARMKLRKG